MASISSLSSSTNSALGSLRGYGGLSSGLDRDTLIEGMTYATQSKIDKQNQAKQKLLWQQEAYREISDKMIAFAEKYTSTLASKTNLFSDALWNAANTSVNGDNSKYVAVTGTSKGAADVSILGVQQMAKNASMLSGSTVSDHVLKTGFIDTGSVAMNTLDGKEIDFKIGDASYSITLPNKGGELYENAQAVADAINKALAEEDVNMSSASGGTKKLSQFIQAGVDDSGNLTFKKADGNTDEIRLTGGSALEYLGFQKNLDELTDEAKANGIPLFEDSAVSAGGAAKFEEDRTFAQRMGGRELTFSYNGKAGTIQLPSQEEIEKAVQDGKDPLEFVKDKMQDALDVKFGKGRVKAEIKEEQVDDGKGGTKTERRLTFRTTIPNETEKDDEGNDVAKTDTSSTLTLTEGSSTLMSAHGGMGITAGESNRLNQGVALKDSGLKYDKTGLSTNGNGKYELKIGEGESAKTIEFSENDSISSIMKQINESGAGIKMSYLSTADKFVIESIEDGASGAIQLSGDGAKLLFGEEVDSTKADQTGAKNSITKGQDAIIAVKYAGSSEPTYLSRGSNNFNIEGLDVTVKGEFGFLKDENGNIVEKDGVKQLDAKSEAVTFTSNVDTEKLVSAVSDLVKEYNEILEMVNNQLSTRPDRDYQPLTSEQKKEMSEDEIKLWEEKAKSGLLYNSSELRSLANDLRWMINPVDQQAMSAMGIEVSSSWYDNGKISFDENKFKAALEKDVDAVKAAFTKEGGFANNLKTTMDKYVRTIGSTKGILIEKAGSTKSPTSVLKNKILDEMKDIDKILENLKKRLKSEQDRYISQFTQLETVISQMNAQSSYLSGLGF